MQFLADCSNPLPSCAISGFARILLCKMPPVPLPAICPPVHVLLLILMKKHQFLLLTRALLTMPSWAVTLHCIAKNRGCVAYTYITLRHREWKLVMLIMSARYSKCNAGQENPWLEEWSQISEPSIRYKYEGWNGHLHSLEWCTSLALSH